MSQVTLQAAFLLHQRPYRDTSRLVEFWSCDYGRVGAVARGARRPKSKLRSALVPFVPLLVSWSGRGELMTLTHAEAPPACTPPRDYRRIVAASYVNELLLRLVQRGDPHPELYADYAETLHALMGDAVIAPSLRLFEKRLLGHIGYGLNLAHTADDAAVVEPDRNYRYEVERGAIALSEGVRDDTAFAGASLLALARESLGTAQALRDARRLLRAALDARLGPTPLRSRSVANALWRHGNGNGETETRSDSPQGPPSGREEA